MNRLRRSWIFCCPVLGFRHCTVLANTWPCPPAQHHCTVVHIACPYLVIVGSILSEDEKAPLPFLIYLQYIIYLLSSVTYSQIHQNFSKTVQYRHWCMTVHDSAWQSMTVHDSAWQCMTVHDSACHPCFRWRGALHGDKLFGVWLVER